MDVYSVFAHHFPSLSRANNVRSQWAVSEGSPHHPRQPTSPPPLSPSRRLPQQPASGRPDGLGVLHGHKKKTMLYEQEEGPGGGRNLRDYNRPDSSLGKKWISLTSQLLVENNSQFNTNLPIESRYRSQPCNLLGLLIKEYAA